MHRDLRRWLLILGLLALVFIPVWMVFQHVEFTQEGENREGREIIPDQYGKQIIQGADRKLDPRIRDQLLTNDLSITTSFFIGQLERRLERWSSIDFSNETLVKGFEQELEEHPHFSGFAVVEDRSVTLEKGDITKGKLQAFIETLNESKEKSISEPFTQGGRQCLLLAVQNNDQDWIIGQIDLSFVKGFVGQIASVADANGNLFISSEGEKEVEWDSAGTKDGFIEQEVPELGWKIVMRSTGEEEETIDYPEGEVIVEFHDLALGEEWIRQHREYQVRKKSGPYMVIAHEKMSTQEMIQHLRENENIRTVEPNYTFTRQETGALPNDEFYNPYQWNLSQIQAERGWEFTSGSEDVMIAYLDTGIDTEHQDLADKLTTGFNAFDETDEVFDFHGHGTHVAGIIGAITNNATGIAGVAWENPIMPVKVLNEKGEGSLFEVASGIRWATDQGAKVINMSLGDTESSQMLRNAVRYAYENDVVLIAAAGNDNVGQAMYPAGYDEVLAVSAVDNQNRKAIFSNFGEHIDVAAPGEHIPSTFPDNHYVFMSGTSMAAPHVAGLAGLIRSLRPDLSNQQVMDIIRYTSDDLGQSGHDHFYGYGQINIARALEFIHNNEDIAFHRGQERPIVDTWFNRWVRPLFNVGRQ